ncbi:CHAT domain-containing protein [Leptothoe sp. PORK10 BA2]|uniref:CHAT domain-containing protein n=1 Tax=Leptothoe sp. PORK10 BA2 TaxID=3110254 RepID=UPI002B21C095|nr:tetratricopeptide repeat protein [Leptothoe sp. PORK10 BA2]MEA5466939.1 tetratricopeptide repeat protein [Leptothoe sp. PORK10 BA2]
MSLFRCFTLSPIILSLTLGAVSGLTLETLSPRAAWAQTDLSSQADRLRDEGLELYRVSQWRQALDNWQQALELYRQAGDRGGEATTLGNIGVIYNSLGDYPQALDYQEQSLALSRELGDRVGESRALGNIGNIYQFLGDYLQALDYQEQSLALSRELGDRATEAQTLGNIGNIYQFLGDYPQALAYQEQSLALTRELGDRATEANALGNIGNIYQFLGDYPQALAYQEQSLAIKRDLGDRGVEATILGNIGIIYSLLGDYPQALDYLEQSLALTRELSDRAGEARALGNIGNIYQVLGDYPQALDYLEQSLALTQELGDRATEADVLGNIGIIYQVLGDYSQALDYLEQSLALTRELGDRGSEAITLGNIGNIYYLLGDYPQALDYQEQSLALTRELGDRAGEANALGNIGNIYDSLGDYPQALDYLEQSLALTRELGNRAGEALILGNIGYLFEAEAEPELAIIFFKEAVNGYEEIRKDNQVFEQALQDSYTAKVEDTYRALANLLLEQGRIPEAQQVLDLLKIEELREFTRASWESGRLQHTDIEQPVIKSHGSLIALGLKLYHCRQTRCDDLNSLRTEQRTLTAEYENQVAQFAATIAANDRDDGLFQDPNSLSDDAYKLLQANPNAALIYPFVTDEKLWLLWAAAGGAVGSIDVDVSQGELSKAVQQFGELLSSPGPLDPLQAKSQQLHDWLIKPLEAELKANNIQQLIFVNDRVTRYIPMAALYDGETYLMERYTLSTVIAPAITDTEETLGTVDSAEILGLGLTKPVEGFNALPAVAEELNAIVRSNGDDAAGIYPGQVLMDDEFTLESMQNTIEFRRILHIATHAQFEPSQPEDSFILLGNGRRMSIKDIDIMQESLRDLHLVVLSACQTALGGPTGDGSEIAGISSYFLSANRAATVLATLWQVDDTGTSLLMQRFYTLMASGELTKAEALRQAQLSLLKNENTLTERLGQLGISRGGLVNPDATDTGSVGLTHPYYWAPFTLMGNSL